MSYLLHRAKKPVSLGQQLGRGGEGKVYLIEGSASQVAKIYHAQPDSDKIRKLVAMTESTTPGLLQVAAWPVDLLAEQRTNTIVGFVMPSVTAKRDIHELYSPKSRLQAFPKATFSFLCHVAANTARAFALLHEHGHVVGDVNHGNLVVADNGTVTLIDSDSFQICAHGSVFLCNVGSALFTPPELQTVPFRGLVRTREHDSFGLAVLIFHLLFQGRHPFAGRSHGGDLTIEQAIKEGRFAYGRHARSRNVSPPPGVVPFESFGPAVADAFEAAFCGNLSPVARPSAKTWVSLLDALRVGMRSCTRCSGHSYPANVPQCPWCQIESSTGAILFSCSSVRQPGPVSLQDLWRALRLVPDPGTDPEVPTSASVGSVHVDGIPSARVRSLLKAISVATGAIGFIRCSSQGDGSGLGMALVFFFVAYLVWPKVPSEVRDAVNRELSESRTRWNDLLQSWESSARRERYLNKFAELKNYYDEATRLPAVRKKRYVNLLNAREKHQLHRYLDRFLIERANIKGIGPSRKTMLASFGIETAADIEIGKIIQIQGFGPSLADALVQWRDDHARNFRFNAAELVDKQYIDKLDTEIASRQQVLIDKLQKGIKDLEIVNRGIQESRERLLPLLNVAWQAYSEAKAKMDLL